MGDNLFKMKSFGSNIYLINEDGPTLIDAGFPVDLPQRFRSLIVEDKIWPLAGELPIPAGN
ncbi:MAG: hypothetical protein A2V52_05555 [Actinobacteria bacterium RBG_19FT_COMBO_54_7]|uniref:Uncharacterized protein n=1 Tax=Candidatus Solincola sediminis TaxID=1797199 RepID=A0A1F2WPF5_9ACTN|nr:MAG: hypothetical protein A2W01_04090 [Candidatus Solincola sediminis]OFW58742.1 MAG: hypothetical protein A2Y75_10640 [Candidatus Solincola sediminis]OFW67951.1 MAG: hypothetical protein A2V52_05555 [Actinobacteria bacterium RBG_19FT_COMBO_54_7]